MRSFLWSSRKGSRSWQSRWDASELLQAKQLGSISGMSVVVKYPGELLLNDTRAWHLTGTSTLKTSIWDPLKKINVYHCDPFIYMYIFCQPILNMQLLFFFFFFYKYIPGLSRMDIFLQARCMMFSFSCLYQELTVNCCGESIKIWFWLRLCLEYMNLVIQCKEWL